MIIAFRRCHLPRVENDKVAIKAEVESSFDGRFEPIDQECWMSVMNAVIPRDNDCQMKAYSGNSLIHNGSPLFIGHTDSGLSKMPYYVSENDFFKAIIALLNNISIPM